MHAPHKRQTPRGVDGRRERQNGRNERSRATLSAVEPDDVQHMIAARLSRSAIERAASAIASAPVGSGGWR